MKNLQQRASPYLLILIILIVWQICVFLFNIPIYILPAPTTILDAFILEFDILVKHSLVTFCEAILGVFIAIILGCISGILMDNFPKLKDTLYPILIISQNIPMIVLSPLLIIYLGFGIMPKIFIVVLMCYFPITISFLDGLLNVDKEYIDLIKIYNGSKLDIYKQVKIPFALNQLISGIKVSVTYSITGAIVGEWVGSKSGLGYYLLRIKNGYMLDKVFATVLAIILLSLFMNLLVKILVKYAFPYLK